MNYRDIENLRRETVELLSQIERQEVEQRTQERIKAAVDEALAEHEARMKPPPELPKRSLMSPLAKSKFIRARIAAGRTGSEAQRDYMSLPWE
jgi:hypothetical protein